MTQAQLLLHEHMHNGKGVGASDEGALPKHGRLREPSDDLPHESWLRHGGHDGMQKS